MPKYIAIAAITIDGKIAKGPGHMSDWTSKEDKFFMRALLAKCDVVIVGNNTYKTAIRPLSKRNCIVFTSKVENFKVVNDKLIYLNPKRVDINKFVKNISAYAKGFGGLPTIKNNKTGRKIALLGGAQTYSWFLENNLLDELYLTIEPIAFGGGISLFANKKLGDFKFKLNFIKKLNKNGSVLLHYKNPIAKKS